MNLSTPSLKAVIHHNLKTWPVQFVAVRHKLKQFEYRRDDRGFEVGHTLCLKEYDPHVLRYTHRYEVVKITHIERGPQFGIPVGYVIMGIELSHINELMHPSPTLEPLATADGRPYLVDDLG